jgi:hypothetical protein
MEYVALLIGVLLVFALWALPFRVFKWAFGICFAAPVIVLAVAFVPHEPCTGDGCIGNAILLVGVFMFATAILFGGTARLVYRWFKRHRHHN